MRAILFILFMSSFCLGSQALAQTKNPIPAGTSASKGPVNAPVTIVIVSDFQCFYCAVAAKTVNAISKANAKTVRVVFKHNPLRFHRQARQASWAAEAARRQNAFWPMHDKLFASFKVFKQVGDMDALMVQYATALKLNVNKFKQDYKDPKLRAIIRQDMVLAKKLNVRGTPTFFINGRKLVGAKKYNSFQLIVDDEIKKAKRLGAKIADPSSYLTAKNYKQPKLYRTNRNGAPMRVYGIPIDKHNPIRGNSKKALVTVVVFGNLGDRKSAKFDQVFNRVRKMYTDDSIRLVFKHLFSGRIKNARMAHKAAIAAQQQKKFWPMYDALLKGQNTWKNAQDVDIYLSAQAKSLGLNVKKFEQDMEDMTLMRDLSDDKTLAKNNRVYSTPTVFINGIRIRTNVDKTSLKRMIDDQRTLAQGVQKKKRSLNGNKLYRTLVSENKQFIKRSTAKDHAEVVSLIEPHMAVVPSMGSKRAAVTIIEFTDLQCKYCVRSNKALRGTLKQFKGKVRIVSIHKPLAIHSRAKDAARAAIAAQKQGKFWEMQKLIQSNLSRLDESEIFVEFASTLKLNMSVFKKDINSEDTKQRLTTDISMANTLKVSGAPVYFFNGKKVEGAIGPDRMKKEVKAALSRLKDK